jgi:2-polyprenyl-6-methoxyphenol hydroxylase-like FAD-dependent oxidoreductase
MSKPHLDKGRALINWAVDVQVAHSGKFRPQDWNRQGNREDFLPLYELWNFDWLDIPDIIRRTETVFEFPCVDRDPLDRWTFGRATLLGDAAHPLRPMGSNAGAQAIRDARALADALASHTDLDAALHAYESERRPATTKIMLSNRMNGPERVMAMVEERAPQGFTDLSSVITAEELQHVADEYKQLAGFDRDSVNAGATAS